MTLIGHESWAGSFEHEQFCTKYQETKNPTTELNTHKSPISFSLFSTTVLCTIKFEKYFSLQFFFLKKLNDTFWSFTRQRPEQKILEKKAMYRVFVDRGPRLSYGKIHGKRPRISSQLIRGKKKRCKLKQWFIPQTMARAAKIVFDGCI